MASGWIHPRIGELWRSTEVLFVGDVGSAARLPADTLLLVIGERRGSIGLQFRVLYPGGGGWVSEYSRLWEAVNATG